MYCEKNIFFFFLLVKSNIDEKHLIEPQFFTFFLETEKIDTKNTEKLRHLLPFLVFLFYSKYQQKDCTICYFVVSFTKNQLKCAWQEKSNQKAKQAKKENKIKQRKYGENYSKLNDS